MARENLRWVKITAWGTVGAFVAAAGFWWWQFAESEKVIDNAARAVTVELNPSVVRDRQQTLLIQNDADLPIKNVRVVFELPRLSDPTPNSSPSDSATWLIDLNFTDPFPSCIDQSSAEMTRQIGSVKKDESREVQVPATPVGEEGTPRVVFLEGNARGQWWEATTDGKVRKINEPPAVNGVCNQTQTVME